MDRDVVLLVDIRNAARRAASYVEGMNQADFLADAKTRAAVVRELEIVGEASSRISQLLRDSHPEIPWHRLIRLRNFYIHVYDAVNYTMVWTTLTRTMPPIASAIAAMLPSDESLT